MIELDLRLPSRPRAAFAARHSLSGLEGFVEPGLLENLQLLVSELVTNSYLHGRLGAEGWIRLTVSASSASVRVEVIDPGACFAPRPGAPAGGEAGWGLFLVDRIAHRWGVLEDEDGLTHVWFEIDRGPTLDARR